MIPFKPCRVVLNCIDLTKYPDVYHETIKLNEKEINIAKNRGHLIGESGSDDCQPDDEASEKFFIFLLFCIYVWLEFHRHTQFHITTLQRVICIMHYNPTLQQHIPAPVVYTRKCDEGVHQGGSLMIHTELIILLLISPTLEEWKAESTLVGNMNSTVHIDSTSLYQK